MGSDSMVPKQATGDGGLSRWLLVFALCWAVLSFRATQDYFHWAVTDYDTFTPELKALFTPAEMRASNLLDRYRSAPDEWAGQDQREVAVAMLEATTTVEEAKRRVAPPGWTFRAEEFGVWLFRFLLLWSLPVIAACLHHFRNRSGVSPAAESRKRLDGWHRLFVVGALVWGGMVVWMKCDELRLASADHREITSWIENQFEPDEQLSLSILRDRDSEFDPNRAEIEKARSDVKRAAERVANTYYRNSWRLFDLEFTILWVMPLAALYCLVGGAAWVVRGFRTT